MVQCHSIYGEEGASVSYGLRPSKQAYCVWIHLEDTYLGTIYIYTCGLVRYVLPLPLQL